MADLFNSDIIRQVKDNSSRFYTINQKNSIYIYDLYTHDFYRFSERNAENADEKLAAILKNKCKKSHFVPERNEQIIKLNLSNVCNMNCKYCFVNKSKQHASNIQIGKDAIHFAMNTFNPEADFFTASVNSTSESTLEIDAVHDVFDYIHRRTSFDFYIEEFTDDYTPFQLVEVLPKELTGVKDVHELSAEQCVELLNKIISYKDLIYRYPLPDNIVLPEWEQDKFDNYKTLDEYTQHIFNRRYIENLHKDVFRQKKYGAFSVMTNGTNVNDKMIKFLKESNYSSIPVSLDGPKEVNDLTRVYKNGQSAYDDVIKGINKLKENGIAVNIACVVTPLYPKLIELLDFFETLGVASVDFSPVRENKNICFDKDSLDVLFAELDRLYDKLYDDIIAGDFTKFNLIRETRLITPAMLLLDKNRHEERCHWDTDLIVDSNGDIYPCDSTIGIEEFKKGNIYEPENIKPKQGPLNVDEREKCKNCWAKYLCGGTCYYTSWVKTGSISGVDETECAISRKIITSCMTLLSKLMEYGYSSQEIRGIFARNHFENIQSDVYLNVPYAMKLELKGSAFEVKEMYENFVKQMVISGAGMNDNAFIKINDYYEEFKEIIYCVTLYVPVEKAVEIPLEYVTCIENFSLKNCLETQNDECDLDKVKQDLLDYVNKYQLKTDSEVVIMAPAAILFDEESIGTIRAYLQLQDVVL